MAIPSWHVVTWPKVVTGMDTWRGMAPRFRHLGTSVEPDGDSPGLHRGQAVWGTELHGERIGIAWEWREVKSHVVAIHDPMVVLANVDIQDDGGERLRDGQRLLALHELIHELPWQEQIRLGRSLPLAA